MGICCGKEEKKNVLEGKEMVVRDDRKYLSEVNEKDIKYFSFEGKRFVVKPCNIYDGDTFSIIFLYHGVLMKYRCRCLGYDTPEMKPSLKNPNREKEKEMAKKAKERFIELLSKGRDGLVEVECFEFDKYGRLMGEFYIRGETTSINDQLVAAGLAKKYDGGTK